MDIAFPIQLHLLVVIPSLLLGLINVFIEKETRFHKLNGKVWVLFMLIAAFSSFFIMPTGSLTWLNLFSILVIVTVLAGVYAIKSSN